MAEDIELSRSDFRLAYDGEALATHTMDVRDLAPSLLGLGEIFVEANRVLNGEEAKVEIRVTPNVHENCFDIGLQVLQQWETINTLLGTDNAVAAELRDWILSGTQVLGVSGASLFGIYKLLKGKKPTNIIHFNDENGNSLYRYKFDGKEDEILDEKLHTLYQNNKIRRNLSRLLNPITSRVGIDNLTAYVKAKSSGVKITKEEAQSFEYGDTEDEPLANPSSGEPIEAVIRPYSPVYDISSKRWRMWYGDEHHYMDVSESNIRDVVLNSGGALIEDRFRVKLLITEEEKPNGEKMREYKVF